MYQKNDVESLIAALRSASQMSARNILAKLRQETKFNPDLFWNWSDAGSEQVMQYRRTIELLQASRLRFSSRVRTLVTIISFLAMLTVCVMSIVNISKLMRAILGKA